MVPFWWSLGGETVAGVGGASRSRDQQIPSSILRELALSQTAEFHSWLSYLLA